MDPIAFELPTSVDCPTLIHGDCLDVLARMPACSVDVVITDPPAGISFMSKPWDSFKNYAPRTDRGRDVKTRLDGLLADWAVGFVAFLTDVWSEVDRVLKPGGFVCAWALPKTADLAGLALRAVGWEIHDSLLHLFGGGMKKGCDIAKGIDAMHGADREVIEGARGWHHATSGSAGVTHGEFPEPYKPGDHAAGSPVTAPATDDARRWDGWHSQLAPGHEQWLLARKPTRLTYARQVLTHCTGGLHVDACRIPRGEAITRPPRKPTGTYAQDAWTQDRSNHKSYASDPGGSWPRNVLLSCGGEDCPAEALDRQSGVTTSTQGTTAGAYDGPTMGRLDAVARDTGHGDSGGASRFFTKFDDRAWYGGKAHRRDIAGTTRRIKHPTHKNPALIDWLTALLAATCDQTGGQPAIVLDPFMGSGTGGVSAVRKRVRYIGIEIDAGSFAEAWARVMAAVGSPDAATAENASAPVGSQLGLL